MDGKKLKLYKSLFKGREDVFALHWEKKNRSVYMPAYYYDPYIYRLYKIKGGSFKDFPDKSLRPLSDKELIKHLNGKQLIGMYPLLENNRSWFIAADFDKKDWEQDARTFIQVCKEHGLPVYLERSRSGIGGHVWMFFDEPYPAAKSRKIFISLLEEASAISIFDKNYSFDRLFPSQDYHKGKGFGNLIALPLNKLALKEGNSCFIDEQSKPFPDQWKFMASIQKVSASNLDEVYKSLFSDKGNSKSKNTTGKLHIRLANKIFINRSALTPELINFLKENLNFANPEYFVKKNSGKSTWGIRPNFRFIEETEHEVIIPRGIIGKLIRYCTKQNIDYELQDERSKCNPVHFTTRVKLRSHQKSALESISHKEFGIITAPPGSGKTVIALKMIADKRQPALIVVHRKHLMDQWIERITTFLGIPKNEIDKLGSGHNLTKLKATGMVKPAVTVAMIQSLGKFLEKQETDDLSKSFGLIMIDECHHIPAKTYRNTISKLYSYYQYGLTATPFRKGSNGKLISIYLGGIIADIKPEDIEHYKRARIIVRETSLDVPFNPKTDHFETLSKVLVHDTARNKLILSDITTELYKGKKVVIITERKEHIDSLYQFLKQSFEAVTLSGDDSVSSRKAKWKILHSGHFEALITTGQFFGEGTDLQNASVLFLVYPFSFKGKLIQYIGRVQRSEVTPYIYDYRDRKIEYLDRLFLKRNKYYRNLDRQATLFDDVNMADSPSVKQYTLDKKAKIPLDELDFRYGAISFNYQVSKMKTELEFEIENDEIRPELDVLKPYFSNVLKSKYINADVFAEFEDQVLVSQSAESKDLDKINQEIIDKVRFRFLHEGIIGKKNIPESESQLLDLESVQGVQEPEGLYDSEQQLLDDILSKRKVKHYRPLRYLASHHEGSILKLRFVLNPFSFVFLLSGTKQYHIILETLDTEEATYMWHVEKNQEVLKENLRSIDQDLNFIRNKGRQKYLDTQPENFSKIMHDYSDDRKGFITWKDQLEERLV